MTCSFARRIALALAAILLAARVGGAGAAPQPATQQSAAQQPEDVIGQARAVLRDARQELGSAARPTSTSSERDRMSYVYLLLEAGQPDQALQVLEETRQPGLRTRLIIINLLLAENDYRKAAPLIVQFAHDYPEDRRTRELQYAWWTLQDDMARVDQTLQQRRAAGKMALVDRFAAADLQVQELDYAGAERSFLALEQATKDPAAHERAIRGVGQAQFYLQHYRRALATLRQALAVAPADAEALVILGDALLRLGRVREAIGALRLALQMSPWNERAHALLGSGFTTLSYTELFAKYPANFANPGGRIELEKGDRALAVGDVAMARRIYQQVAVAHPFWADAEARLGSLEYLQGHFAAAREYFWNAYTLCPEYGRANEGLASALQAQTSEISIHRAEDEAALQAAPMPVIPGISRYVTDWKALSPPYQKRLALSLQPWARYMPALVLGGETLYVKPIWQLLSQAPYEEKLRDQRIGYDSRLWDDVRAEGGYHLVVSDQDIETSIDDGYDTVLHEVSHQVNGILASRWDRKIEALYAAAMRRQAASGNAFLSQYAASSVEEYFAEGANSFNSHRRDRYDTREIVYERLAERDPALLALVRQIMYRADVRPSYAMSLVSLGADLLWRGKLEQADAAYARALRQDPGNELALVGRMHALVLEGREAQARQLAASSIRLHPNSGSIVAERAEVQWLGGADVAGIVQSLQAQRPLVEHDEQYLVDLTIGELADYIGDFTPAQQAFARVLAYQPDNPDALTGIAATMFSEGKPPDAWKYYDEAARVRSGEMGVHISYARDLLRAGELGRAREQIQAALLIDPHDPEALAVHAWAQMEAGDVSAALRTADRAHRLGPWSTLATIVTAAVERRAGQVSAAGKTLQTLQARIHDHVPPSYVYRSASGEYTLAYLLGTVDLGLMKTLTTETIPAANQLH